MSHHQHDHPHHPQHPHHPHQQHHFPQQDHFSQQTNLSQEQTQTVNAGRYLCSNKSRPTLTFDANVNRNRASLILEIGNKWANGTTLHYYFLPNEGTEVQKNIVRQAWGLWKDIGLGLIFQEVNQITSAEIRIGFLVGDGSWSYVGTDNLTIPNNERTMNFGWDISNDIDAALHEIGHAIGFQHEHQNPHTGIIWNEEFVYRKLAGPPNNWDSEKTHTNIIKKLDTETVRGSTWDKDSIMHYPFEAGMISVPEIYKTTPLIPKGGLSAKDKEYAKILYPPLTDQPEVLTPFNSLDLTSMKNSDQRNFAISPEISAKHLIQTFGSSDVALVLFEVLGDGKTRFLAGDNNSGQKRNASLEFRLFSGSKYVLSTRMVYNGGKSSLMLSYHTR